MSVQVSYKKQSLFALMGLIIIFLVIEIISNVWWTYQIDCEFETNEIFSEINDLQKRQLCLDLYNVRTIGNEIVSNQTFESININSHGFRGDEFSENKSPNVFRIFMLGGSTMFGTGSTSDDYTIPGYLQSYLEQTTSEVKIEVINAGIQAADSKTELNLIQNKLLQFSPDMIIIYDGWNDLRANHNSFELFDTWNTICELGKQKNFKTIISLQPISGFGNKSLTNQELSYVESGTDYKNNLLINLLPLYTEYENTLKKLDSCSLTINMRNAFDNESSAIYWDQGHVSDYGNSIIAKLFFDKISPLILKHENIPQIKNIPEMYPGFKFFDLFLTNIKITNNTIPSRNASYNWEGCL